MWASRIHCGKCNLHAVPTYYSMSSSDDVIETGEVTQSTYDPDESEYVGEAMARLDAKEDLDTHTHVVDVRKTNITFKDHQKNDGHRNTVRQGRNHVRPAHQVPFTFQKSIHTFQRSQRQSQVIRRCKLMRQHSCPSRGGRRSNSKSKSERRHWNRQGMVSSSRSGSSSRRSHI